MLGTLLKCPFVLNRHREAPLLKEREVFLLHLQLQGTSRAALRNLSGELIHVVRLLRLQKLRDVRPEEIRKAAELAHQHLSNPKAHSYVRSCVLFCLCGEKMASLPWPAETVERTACAIRRPTRGRRSIHGIRTGTVAAVYPVKLLEDIEVSDMVRESDIDPWPT
jgi:hypothetical protein